jgi:hypothetical protein
MDLTSHAAAITAGATILAALLAAFMIMFQIGRQAHNAIEQNKRNEAMKLRLKVYEEFSQPAEAMMRAESEFSSYVRNFVTELEIGGVVAAANHNPSTPRARVFTMLDRREGLVKSVVNLMIAIERWEIIDTKLDLFRMGLSVGLHDLHKAAAKHSDLAFRYMPAPRNEADRDGATFPWKLPSDAEVAEIKAATNGLTDASSVLNNYGADFLIAIQNMLVGELFATTRKPRAPLDPKYFALRLDRYAALKKHFEFETDWGREKLAVDKLVLEEVGRTSKKPWQHRFFGWLPFIARDGR